MNPSREKSVILDVGEHFLANEVAVTIESDDFNFVYPLMGGRIPNEEANWEIAFQAVKSAAVNDEAAQIFCQPN